MCVDDYAQLVSYVSNVLSPHILDIKSLTGIRQLNNR